jgi:hypothetical protein
LFLNFSVSNSIYFFATKFKCLELYLHLSYRIQGLNYDLQVSPEGYLNRIGFKAPDCVRGQGVTRIESGATQSRTHLVREHFNPGDDAP